MYSDNKQIRDVADVAAKIMYGQQPVTEKLHPNQQVLDVHEPEKDELTADDFKKLRAKKEVKKEEVEQVDEANRESKKDFDDRQKRLSAAAAETAKDPERLKRMMKIPGYAAAMGLAKKTTTKEEVEQIVEYETNKDGKFVHNAKAGRYGGSEKPQDPFAGVRGPGQKDLEKIEAEKKKKQKKFSEMVNLYQEKGLKSLSEMLVKEEPDNEQFTKELEDAKAKSEGKKKNTEIAKGQPIAPVSVKEEVEELDEISTKTLAAAAKAASDPDSDYYYGKSHDAQKFADHAKKTKDAKSAAAVQGAADAKGHYPRDNHTSGYDKLTYRTPPRVTAAGKANKQDIKALKTKLKEEDMDINAINGVRMSTIGEEEMTDDQMKKREDIVKSMKKGMAGFKDRYGDRAKDVMYATATKQAMK